MVSCLIIKAIELLLIIRSLLVYYRYKSATERIFLDFELNESELSKTLPPLSFPKFFPHV